MTDVHRVAPAGPVGLGRSVGPTAEGAHPRPRCRRRCRRTLLGGPGAPPVPVAGFRSRRAAPVAGVRRPVRLRPPPVPASSAATTRAAPFTGCGEVLVRVGSWLPRGVATR
ncbi:hypothetical protein DDQ41_25890 [Streptomyces spongiicola]|uniref:Uncharacterized protein n=1 Tax=Streptomyces spongiicola TaxID=1690221 RepID=A0ABN5KT61_9ACTN|nr:hypothetical protein DDQ41_25890 [Streptomyces spongiicola]